MPSIAEQRFGAWLFADFAGVSSDGFPRPLRRRAHGSGSPLTRCHRQPGDTRIRVVEVETEMGMSELLGAVAAMPGNRASSAGKY